MKVSRLAKEIGMQPAVLYRELISRGLQIRSVEHPLDTTNTEAIREKAAGGRKIDFDALFGEIRDEFKDEARTVKPAITATYNRRDNQECDSKAFERAVGNQVRGLFPNSHLSGVFLFIAEQLGSDGKFGREIDHLMHVCEGGFHRLLVIECKNQKIVPDPNKPARISLQEREWFVEYTGNGGKAKQKDVKKQMWNQSRAILQMIKPIPEISLQIEAIAVSSDESTEDLIDSRGIDDPRVMYRVMKWGTFISFLEELSEKNQVLRVTQSELLRRLRQGMPCEQLGHPDIRDAIDYHKRLRLTLDFGLFRHFEIHKGKWAINGTAGMGKSVLLAYAACVFCTDHLLAINRVGQLSLRPYDGTRKGLMPHEKRRIVVYSLKEKQRRIVEYYWRLLVDYFQEQDHGSQLRIHRPEITLWQPGQEINGNVVLVDEAHDLNLMAQEKIAKWLNEDPDNRYLVIACDRHQKLRLIHDGAPERMVAGLDFSLCTKKLKRVYRNPFSVYAAGLALMFRWFAPTGPKVVPSIAQLKDSFGFEVIRRDTKSGTGCELELVEDAHPANRWHHCVSDFPDAATAHAWLEQYNLGVEDVLWLRFAKEDSDFDYEQLQKYQYHNLFTSESTGIIDKYIKGQEFPVVILEGVGKDFNNTEAPEAMFVHRRELYLCASRATIFLFFIHSSETLDEKSETVRKELNALRQELCRPKKITDATQFWGLQFDIDDGYVPLSQFEDLVDPIDLDPNNTDAETDKAVEETIIESKGVDIDADEPPQEEKKHQEPPAQTKEPEPIETRKVDPASPEKSKITIQKKKEEQDTEEENPSRNVVIEQNPTIKNGYTLLQAYTPQTLAQYLDIKAFKVIQALMNIPDHRSICSLNQEITRKESVEEVCAKYGQPAPWAHPKLGRNIHKLRYDTQGISSGNIEALIKKNYPQKMLPKHLPHRLIQLGVTSQDKNESISAFEIYALLKELELDVDLFLRRVVDAENIEDLNSKAG